MITIGNFKSIPTNSMRVAQAVAVTRTVDKLRNLKAVRLVIRAEMSAGGYDAPNKAALKEELHDVDTLTVWFS